MGRLIALVYGLLSYAFFFVTFIYAILFVENMLVPKSIDVGQPSGVIQALIINLMLMSLFAIQHSVMARPQFKQWWMQFVPKTIERSTYVLFSTLALALLCWQWRPITAPVWHVANPVAATLLTGLSLLGWLLALFGLQQVFNNFTARKMPAIRFRTRLLYRFVRHPLSISASSSRSGRRRR